MKKALKIGAIGLLGCGALVYGGVCGYVCAWKELFDRGNYVGADVLLYVAKCTFRDVPRWLIENAVKYYTKSKS